MLDPVILEIEDSIARISLNRSGKRNAANLAMWSELTPLLLEADEDRSVRVIMLQSSTAGMFCAGADIGEFADCAADPVWRAKNQSSMRGALLSLTRAAKPTIAVIDGDCIGGGCALALACDIRIASIRARFGITPAKLGLIYPLHDTKLLVDLVGPAQAKRLLFTGELISADDADRIGLVQRVFEVSELEASALDMARTIAANSAFSTTAMKSVVQRILDGTTDDDAESARLFDAAFTKKDFTEGVSAFQSRREPRFGDK